MKNGKAPKRRNHRGNPRFLKTRPRDSRGRFRLPERLFPRAGPPLRSGPAAALPFIEQKFDFVQLALPLLLGGFRPCPSGRNFFAPPRQKTPGPAGGRALRLSKTRRRLREQAFQKPAEALKAPDFNGAGTVSSPSIRSSMVSGRPARGPGRFFRTA